MWRDLEGLQASVAAAVIPQLFAYQLDRVANCGLPPVSGPSGRGQRPTQLLGLFFWDLLSYIHPKHKDAILVRRPNTRGSSLRTTATFKACCTAAMEARPP